ncbi:hypothetical protein ACE6H2_025600 [Prunus campanulata]
MGGRPGGSIRGQGQDPPPVLHPVTKFLNKNDDEDLWIRIWLLPLTTNVVMITTFRIVDEGEGSCIIKTLHSTVYNVEVKGESEFYNGFSFSLDCEDNEPKGGGEEEEEETVCQQELVEKRCKGKRGTKKKPTKSIKSLGICLKRRFILGKPSS